MTDFRTMKRVQASPPQRCVTKVHLLLVGVTALVVVLSASAVVAQISNNYDLSWYVLAGGGGAPEGSLYAMDSTMGQGVVGSGSSASFGMGSGYWDTKPGVSLYRTYLPLLLRNGP